ncbi:hypothetical protein EJF36_03085 [Bacillus sp. HMF5848]|uniref:DUF4097 family beta strand repeat-containing protein n=1 Tax=Bacillus sp. HMF5848 TaxID=2495421 RepID=UPI000F769064|nr:DUF4097 family beta strand repeat-containing protein [Bacillus sp. HMF5848]RSK25961.1 hypothetical protein EJF36_03085 [Bacillus sp. HMF5848]
MHTKTSSPLKGGSFCFRMLGELAATYDFKTNSHFLRCLIIFDATSGDVIVDMGSQSYALDFKGMSGDGVVDVSGFMFSEKSDERIVGQIGKGDTMVFVRTKSGDLTVK